MFPLTEKYKGDIKLGINPIIQGTKFRQRG